MTFSASSGRIVIAKSTRWSQVRSATTVGPEFYKPNTPNVTSHEQGGEATKGRKSLRPQRVGCREREREIWAAPPPAEALGSPHPILPPPPSLLTGRCTSLVDTLPSSSRGRGRPPFWGGALGLIFLRCKDITLDPQM